MFYNFLLVCLKISESADLNYCQRNGDVILQRAKDYYENDKKRLREQARDKYRNLSEEEKIKRENMGRIDTAICLMKRKKRLKENQKNYREAKKSQYNNKIIF